MTLHTAFNTAPHVPTNCGHVSTDSAWKMNTLLTVLHARLSKCDFIYGELTNVFNQQVNGMDRNAQ